MSVEITREDLRSAVALQLITALNAELKQYVHSPLSYCMGKSLA